MAETDALFSVAGHGITMSDAIALGALLVAIGALWVSWRTDSRERASDRRAREKEAREAQIRVAIVRVTEEIESPGPKRFIDLRIQPALDGIADEIEKCSVVRSAKFHHLDLVANGEAYRGEQSVETPNWILPADGMCQVQIAQHYIDTPRGETVLKFDIVRQDERRSRTYFELTVPPAARFT